jgi:hypothetical protein
VAGVTDIMAIGAVNQGGELHPAKVTAFGDFHCAVNQRLAADAAILFGFHITSLRLISF